MAAHLPPARGTPATVACLLRAAFAPPLALQAWLDLAAPAASFPVVVLVAEWTLDHALRRADRG